MNSTGSKVCLVGALFHWGCLPHPPGERRLWEDAEPAMLVPPP